MKLVNVTNSHSRLVKQQLENTDASLVKVFTAGNTTVIYTEAPLHNEIVIVNNKRRVHPEEVEEIKNHFLAKIPSELYSEEDITILEDSEFIEISIPKVLPVE